MNLVKQQLYPFTLTHLAYFAIFTVVTTYILNYFLKFRLLKWIYVGTLVVIGATLYNRGDDEEAALDAFKLTRM